MMNWKQYSYVTALLLLTKFFWFRMFIYDDKNPIRLIWAEASTVAIIVVIFALLFYKRKVLAYVITNFLLSTFLLAVVLYFDYYGKIMTFEAIKQIGQVKEVSSSVFNLVKPQYFVLYLDLILFYCWHRWIQKNQQHSEQATMHLVKRLGIILGCLLIIFTFEGVKAERTADIKNATKKAQQLGLITYQLETFLNEKEIPVWNEAYDARIKQIKAEREKSQVKEMFGVAKDKNLLVIQLEAFQSILINQKVNGVEVTPNLNALIKESMYFPHFYQQVGQGNTSDAEFISNTSIYPLEDAPMSETFGDREIPSLPRLLNNQGYKTMTFHVNKVDFWNRDEMYPALGFDQYYDTDFFGYEDVVGLGPSDEILFDKAMPVFEETTKQHRPFYAQMVTLTGHHPFVIPEEKIEFPLPEEMVGTQIGNYIQTQHYVDQQVGKLIHDMKQNGLWENTVIALYGDHFGISQDEPDKNGKMILENLLGRSYDKADAFAVPFIVKVPGMTEGKTYDTVGGQIDIMPTIANLMGLDLSKETYFGQDLVNTKSNMIGERFYMPSGSFINDTMLYTPGQSFEDGKGINYRTGDRKIDYTPYKEQYDLMLELLEISDAYVHQLPKR
ncbi:LTA synthase family protein [Brevibacillus daliensis]|uniref:LTA synthase family protein n=1 Tax=Brevibacillus daliensis TaxID=2892995 RepID=UPI001E41A7C6|nr:LTA synthase family protein [Brevibacillus daliensis]